MPAASVISTDLYGVLGVDASAGGDEIARAFRARAKLLHPDTSAEPDAAERFNTLVAAYGVLSNHRTRREYDESRRAGVRTNGAPGGPGGPGGSFRAGGTPGGASPKQWTRRRAWTALVGGALVTVLGVGAGLLTWHLHATDARQRAAYVRVTALRVGDGDITFSTAAGRTVRTREPTQHGEGADLGPTVSVRYDPARPTHVIVDGNTLGRDITLVIVSLKLLVGGPVFVVLGARRLRRSTAAR